MSWGDLLFPGNPKRREDTVRLFTTLLTKMGDNFKTTNDLIDIIHKYVPGKKFQKIEVGHDLTIKENCDRIITRINEISAYMKEKKKQIKANIDPALYRDIFDTKVDFARTLDLASKIKSAALMAVGTIASIGVTAAIGKGKILVTLVKTTSVFKAAGYASIALGIGLLQLDLIVSAIMGHIERSQLEESIRELESALETFVPASREYSKRIMSLGIRIELYEDNKPSWSKQFFPGNPARRDEVQKLFTQLLTDMENNFKTTNDLIAILHEHLPGKKFQNIKVDRDLSIKENCDRFITRLQEISAHLTEKEKAMKTKIDPVIYSQIMDMEVAFGKKVGLARNIAGDVLITMGTASGLGVCATVQTGQLHVSLVDKMTKLKVVGAADVMIGIGFAAMDRIAWAIIAAVQSGKIEESMKELESLVGVVVPVSAKYGKQITKISYTIDILAEMGLA